MRLPFVSQLLLPPTARPAALSLLAVTILLAVSASPVTAQDVPPPDPSEPDPIIYTTAITDVPVVTKATVSGLEGQPFRYQITATNSPTSFGAQNLPAGLTVDPATGVISGEAQYAGNYESTVSATNSAGTGTRKLKLAMFVRAVPVVTIAREFDATLDADASTPGSFLLTRTGGDLADYVQVTYTVAGTALGGVNYQPLKGVATIKATRDKNTKHLKIQPLNAADFTGKTALKITLEPGLGYILGDQITAKVKIFDSK